MEDLDSVLKDFLARRRNPPGGTRLEAEYPTSQDFHRFIMNEMNEAEEKKMLNHLKEYPEDQALVTQARQLIDQMAEADSQTVPSKTIRRAKALFGKENRVQCPHCGKSITPFKQPPRLQLFWGALWLGLGLASFSLSFVFPGYFFQFLVAALLFGIKWIVDQKARKTQVLIYRALREDGGEGHKEIYPVRDPHDISH